ncbi:2-polyprenylphenol 6-hydroxylase [Paracoccus sp. p3-h83]|uniref:2-polyprenylphenol 6-hydroxylase n=1 Tax=Paracoccus sp. p3-h83 TaxID=3342805 RepID=UPI0035B95FEB
MRGPHNIWRLIRTGATFERTGAMGVALDAMQAPRRLRIAAHVLGWPFRWLGYKGDPALPPVTRAITALGPAYIKFGQILSTRPDVVGADLADQLRVLQDRLPPFPTDQARAAIEAELGQPIAAAFSTFDPPVAAASIAQVHPAHRADTGAKVAVKVLRPGIERAFRRDIDAFHFAARLIEALSPASRRLRPTDIIAHFESVVMGELDLRLEAASASEFVANTEADTGLTTPRPHWDLSGRSVLTSDWAEGVSVGDVAGLRAAGHDPHVLGERILQLFLKHALRDGFFHADMHHGNMKVGADGNIILYDFGIMGQIDEYTRRVYAEILMGFIARDYRRVAEVHFEAGYVPRDRDVNAFARALRAVGEPIFGVDADKISMAKLLAYLFEVTERFGMQTRTELILLQRTMVVVEGVARSLHPQINIWEVARPVVESYIRTNLGPRALARDLLRTAQTLARFGPQLPHLVEDSLNARLNPPPVTPPRRYRKGLAAAAMGGALVALGVLIGAWL